MFTSLSLHMQLLGGSHFPVLADGILQRLWDCSLSSAEQCDRADRARARPLIAGVRRIRRDSPEPRRDGKRCIAF